MSKAWRCFGVHVGFSLSLLCLSMRLHSCLVSLDLGFGLSL